MKVSSGKDRLLEALRRFSRGTSWKTLEEEFREDFLRPDPRRRSALLYGRLAGGEKTVA